MSFSAGQTTRTFTVSVNGDVVDELDETFVVNLTSPVNATISDSQAVGTITDDDASTISINDVSVAEGNSGTTNANFTVSLSKPSDRTVTVTASPADNTAVAPGDYTGIAATVTFTPGQTTATYSVSVKGDLVDENNELFNVNLTAATNATIADAQGVGTITDDDTATISINDVTELEGNTGGFTNAYDFTVSLSSPSDRAVTVDAATADDTAIAGQDYLTTAGTITFAPGETSKTFTVMVGAGTPVEDDEQFLVNLTNSVNAAILDPQGIGTIINDDFAKLSVNDVTVTEGDAGTVNATFTVTSTNSNTKTMTVQAATASDTAVAPGDYTAASTTLTFTPGQTAKNFTVAVNGDLIDELAEQYFVNLSAPVNATITDAQGIGTITDDDTTTISVADLSVTEGDAGLTTANFTVSLSNPSDRTVSVNAATADDTASQLSDYVAGGTALTFTPGQTTRTFAVTVNGDVIDELDERFFVNLTAPGNATIADGQAIGTINDDDTARLSVNDVSVTEGNSGTVNATFTVSSSNASDRAMSVNYSTADDTAVSPGDYTGGSGTLTFAAGETSKIVTVAVKGDTKDENDETFNVNLTAAVNATITDPQGVGTIIDDESTTLSINDVTVTEGDSGTSAATFTVSLSTDSDRTVTVSAASANDTATAPNDYLAASGTLTFAPGETSKTFSVAVNGDLVDELTERFFVNLSGATNASISDGQGIGTITDDDTASLSINDVTLTEGNGGTANATFTVSSPVVSDRTVTVLASTADDSATAPSDYAAKSATVTIPAGTTSSTFTVSVNGDLVDELNERFFVNLSGATNASIADGQGIGTITDDDTMALSVDDVTVTEGDSGIANATFTVSASNASDRTATVVATTANDTAVAPGDYVGGSSTLTFAAGQTTKTFTVAVNGDLVDELAERYFVNLSAPSNATIADGQGIGTITDDDTASASIDDVTVTEGDTGTVNATFTVSLSTGSDRTVSVDAASSNDTAIAPGDYSSAGGTISFSPGQTSRSFTVAVNGDLVDELTERFFVNLAAPVNASIADGQGIGTINDDDTASISINDVTHDEGNGGATTDFVFTISLSTPSDRTVTVDAATADSTATAGSDYTAASGTVSFSPGQTSRTFTVVVGGGVTVEDDEQFFVNLTNAVNAAIADDRGIGTILNDDVASFSISDATVTEGNGTSVNASFTISLSNPSTKNIHVDIGVVNDTAVAPDDYTPPSVFSTAFAPGQTSKTFTVVVKSDLIDELDERFFVNLSNAVNATITDGQGIGTILDDDTSTISVADASVTEGDAGLAAASFTVSLSNPSDRTVSVNAATSDGSASQLSDYVAASGLVTFAPGQTVRTFSVTVNGDLIDELSETFSIDLSGAANATVADGHAVGTILDDDTASLSINDVSVTEGDSGTTNAVFTVSSSNPSDRTISVTASPADDTAVAPGDYTGTSGTLTFAAGQTSKTFAVAVNGDLIDELDERFNVNLTAAVNATITDAQGVGTISDDDTATLSIDDVTVAEGDSGTVNATFTVQQLQPQRPDDHRAGVDRG